MNMNIVKFNYKNVHQVVKCAVTYAMALRWSALSAAVLPGETLECR